MEPAWRQQGRGRGRSQEAQVERSRPLQRERERPGTATGRGVRTKTGSAPEPPHGDETLHGPTPPVGCVAGVSLLILPCGPQVWLSNPSLRRSGNPTRLLLSDWSRATSAPPPLMKTTTASMMETTRKEREGRSWRPPSPPTPTRQVSSQALPWQHHCEDQLVKLIVLPVFLPGVQMFEDSKVSLI